MSGPDQALDGPPDEIDTGGSRDRTDTGGAPDEIDTGGSQDRIYVVGIGAGGWDALSRTSQEAVLAAEVVLGSDRQLGLLPDLANARRVPLPSPLRPGLPRVLAAHAGRRLCVLASGDPMAHGIGAVLAEVAGAGRLRVLPHPSSVSLACARLGWPAEGVEVVNLGGRPPSRLTRALAPGRRIVVLAGDSATVARLLTEHGYGASRLTLLAQLGGPDEAVRSGPADGWPADPDDPLCVLAVECADRPAGPVYPTSPGLPDSAFENDGQLTKRDLRAAALARLAPLPGQLLWDVGAGAGSVAIEWLRHQPSGRAVAIERDAGRAARIGRNAAALGVPELRVVTGSAPAALSELPQPDAVFVGGAVADEAVLAYCHRRLAPGGRLVAHAVTVEAEAVLVALRAEHGGELTRLAVDHAEPLGRFTTWRRSLVVTQWALTLPY